MTDFTRDALMQRNADEFTELNDLVARVRSGGRLEDEFTGRNRDCSVRDVLAHLLAWHLLFERWSEEGMRGGAPAIPAAGYTWRELDDLNAKLREDWSAAALDDVIARLDASHDRLQAALAAYTDDQLTDATAFAWTQGSPLGEFFLENGGNHYRWARGAITEGLALDL